MPGRITAALLFSVMAVCLYRARTQSFTIDEAWVFHRFVDKPLAEMAKSWDACNHVLHTVLMNWCRDVWGISEHVLRIPSMLGAALYLGSVYYLTRLLFSGWRQPLAAALLVLHPLVLDLLVAARGYGLALGLFGWALFCAFSYCIRGFDPKWLSRAGVLSGLAIAANLTFAVPVVALGIAIFAIRRTWRVIDWYFGPAVVISTLIVMLPLLQAKPHHFYFGESNLLETFSRMYTSALKTEQSMFFSLGWALAPYMPFAVGMLFLVVGVTAGAKLWRGVAWEFRQAPFALAGATVAACIVGLLVLGFFGTPYPSGRSGLYLIPLITLATMLLVAHRRFAAWVGMLVVVFYISETDNRYFVDWRYDTGTRDLIRRFDEDRYRRRLPNPVRIAVSDYLEPTASYYRIRRKTPWMQIEDINATDVQYALLQDKDAGRASSPSYEVVARHPVSGAVLVRRVQ